MAREPGSRGQADAAVDPTLAQKKRARHRLVGAIALCLLAALLIPLILESEPRQPPRDIPLEIDPQSQPVRPTSPPLAVNPPASGQSSSGQPSPGQSSPSAPAGEGGTGESRSAVRTVDAATAAAAAAACDAAPVAPA